MSDGQQRQHGLCTRGTFSVQRNGITYHHFVAVLHGYPRVNGASYELWEDLADASWPAMAKVVAAVWRDYESALTAFDYLSGLVNDDIVRTKVLARYAGEVYGVSYTLARVLNMPLTAIVPVRVQQFCAEHDLDTEVTRA